ncbi:ketoacyl-ACP synthase III [Streptomyces sp. NBC_01511]|uniref:3-oxoacyl-ACP synthase III family protein n=1 Tax=unclassified Streptomyces TaxID=2593676 RepID=UPI0038681BEA
MTLHSRIGAVAVHLPERRLSVTDVEEEIAAGNPHLDLPRGLIEQLTGVRHRYVAPVDWQASDLGVAASRQLFEQTGLGPGDIDLVVFAAASGDVLEPATAHIVAERLGMTCPVFDLKNACNSVLNAIETGDALIRAGSYRRILVTCGEAPTRLLGTTVASVQEYVESCAALTMSDVGAALLLEASDEPGVLAHRMGANSRAWRASVTSMTTNTEGRLEIGRLKVKPLKMLRSLAETDFSLITKLLAENDLAVDDFDVVCVSQISVPYTRQFCRSLGIPDDKVLITVDAYGCANAASIPQQLAAAEASGRLRAGDLVCLIGLGSGLSFGVVVVRW